MCGVCVYVRTIIRIHQEDEKCRDREEEDSEQCFQNALIATPLPPPPPPSSVSSSQLSRHARNGLLQQDHSVSGVQCEYMVVYVIYQATRSAEREDAEVEKTQSSAFRML